MTYPCSENGSLSYEKPEILATFTEEELTEEATVCVCYIGCVP